MLNQPEQIPEQFPVRKTKLQKQAFREAAVSFGEKLDYPVTIEKGTFGCQNVIFGDPETAQYLVTAHYDTPARLPFPNFATPCNGFRSLVRRIAMIAAMVLMAAVVIGVVTALTKTDFLIPYLSFLTALLVEYLMLCGPANPHNANDNTSGVITVMEMMKTFPENQRHKVCFVLFDMEEQGLIGSGAYRKAHKAATEKQLVLNLDCVGDGDHIRMFPTKKLRKDREKCTALYKACGYFGKKDILVHEKGYYSYASDQRRFPYGVGICALNKRKRLLYLSRIHTPKDTVLDMNNVNILRAALTSFICCDEVN
jgi:hypothetical protein